MAMNGGLRIDGDGETTVKGLFAAGETAGGPHGADRLGGGMLTVSQVFGRRAGIAAAQVKRKEVVSPLIKQAGAQAEQLMDHMLAGGKSGKYKAYDLRRKIQHLSSQHLMLNRNEEGLLQYQKELAKLEDLLHGNTEVTSAQDLHKIMEMRNLLQTGKIVAQAALMRKETRGGHLRSDFPQTNPEIQWVFVSKAKDGSPESAFVPVGS